MKRIGSRSTIGLSAIAATLLIVSCDMFYLLGRRDSSTLEYDYSTQLAEPETRSVDMSIDLAVQGDGSQMSIVTSADRADVQDGSASDVSWVDIGIGQPGFIVDDSATFAIPLFVPYAEISEGSSEIGPQHVALGIIRLTPFSLSLTSDAETTFLDEASRHAGFQTLVSDIEAVLLSSPATLHDYEAHPHIYDRAIRIAEDTYAFLTATESRAVVGRSGDIQLSDEPATGIDVVNPKATYYGVEVDGGEAWLVEAKESFFGLEWAWPPIQFQPPVNTNIPLDSGVHRLRMYKGFNILVDGEPSLEWMNPLSAAGKATYANALVHVRLMLKTTGLVLSATGAGAGAGVAINTAGACLNHERIAFLLTLDEKIRQQEWIGLLCDGFVSGSTTAKELLVTALSVFAESDVFWDQLKLWLWENKEFQTAEEGLEFTDFLKHLKKTIHAITLGLDAVGLVNEALPFYYDIISAPWVIDFTVDFANGSLSMVDSSVPPHADISVSPGTVGVGEPVEFEAVDVSDDIDGVGTLVFRWDFDSDGVWDTAWESSTSATHAYATRATHTVTLEVRDLDGLIGRSQASVSVGSREAFKIVLTWGEDPRDLDSHLVTPEIGGASHHVYYADSGTLGSAPFAWLDIDDVNSYGPETIWIEEFHPGNYVYSVYLYAGSGSLNTSSVAVTVVTADGLQQSFNVPTSGSGRWWNVFVMDGTSREITEVNTLSESMYPVDADSSRAFDISSRTVAADAMPRKR